MFLSKYLHLKFFVEKCKIWGGNLSILGKFKDKLKFLSTSAENLLLSVGNLPCLSEKNAIFCSFYIFTQPLDCASAGEVTG